MHVLREPHRRLAISCWPALAAALAFGCFTAPAQQPEPATTTDLHRAARAGDVALLRSRLAHGASPNVRDAAGRTPLMEAVAGERLDAMRLLLSGGADANAAAHDGSTPLIQAAAQGSLDAARLLAESGADLNLAPRGWGSALKTAERNGHEDVAAMLLKAGARSTGSSVGDTVCVRPWDGDGYCGTVEAVAKTHYRLRVTAIVGCQHGCPAKAECSAGRAVAGSEGIAVGDVVDTVSWCLTHTGVKP